MADGSITRWIGLLKEGDPAAAQPLWEAYFGRLVKLARQRLGGAPRRAADEEDVALSAFDSFCTGARAGQFPHLSDRNNLWPLLVAITAHKCTDLVRHEARRGSQKQADPEAFEQLIATEPTPEFAAQVADELRRLLSLLDRGGDGDLRPIALARLEGAAPAEIAVRLGCVRRTVERKLAFIARLWAEEGDT
jgi:DNA-directed RNA polymerase specialized sigma24 family protein